jgi:hypothetical protein
VSIERKVHEMPEIVRFYGIVIKIFFQNEHNPPHIHAVYNEHNGVFNISTMEMMEGDLPIKAQKLVREWGEIYRNELMAMWENKMLKKLPPLE